MKIAAIAFVFMCSAWYYRETVAEVTPSLGQPSDFSVYYQAAGNVASGHSPFVTESYIYPPLLAELLAPVAKLPYLTARWIWFLFSQACLLLAAGLMWRALGGDSLSACVIALVWALGGAATESLALGQPGPELMLLLAIVYSKRDSTRPVAAALGFAIKVIPGIVAFTFLLRRQGRAFAIFAAVSLLLLAIPWLLVIGLLDGPRTPEGSATWTGTPAILSWSLPSLALRLSYPPLTRNGPLPHDWESGNDLPHLNLPPWRKALSVGVALATLLTGLLILARMRVTPDQDALAMAALIALALAAAPVCWTHYQLLQYPGAVLMLARAARSRDSLTLAAGLLSAALLYPLPAAVLGEYFRKYALWTESPATFYLWTSVTPFASLALFALLLREFRRATPPPV